MRAVTVGILSIMMLFSAPQASAADISFGFTDDPSITLFDYKHVAGSVRGILHDVPNKGAEMYPSSPWVTITSAPAAFGLSGDYKIMQPSSFVRLKASAGVIEDIDIAANFTNDSGTTFSLWLNNTSWHHDMNWLNRNLTAADGSDYVGQVLNENGMAGLKLTLLSSSDPEPVTPAVPEPATWMLAILGFGVVGYAMRRRPANRPLSLC